MSCDLCVAQANLLSARVASVERGVSRHVQRNFGFGERCPKQPQSVVSVGAELGLDYPHTVGLSGRVSPCMPHHAAHMNNATLSLHRRLSLLRSVTGQLPSTTCLSPSLRLRARRAHHHHHHHGLPGLSNDKSTVAPLANDTVSGLADAARPEIPYVRLSLHNLVRVS